jgi:multicomponent Na+:H+ antiporter subunit E
MMKKTLRLAWFMLWYIFELVKANIDIARQIISPKPRIRPGILKVELDARSDQEVLGLSNLISMTPGSLTMDISYDKKYIFIHEMYIDDVEEARQRIKVNLESRILKITRA